MKRVIMLLLKVLDFLFQLVFGFVQAVFFPPKRNSRKVLDLQGRDEKLEWRLQAWKSDPKT